MKIVIKISEDDYRKVQDGRASVSMMQKAIRNGIPHETVTEFADRCRECGREKVLDKIRAEINTHRETLKTMADDDWYAGKIRGYDCAIEIINKYRAESEA